MYETFEHTADLGLRVRASDPPGLFAEAGKGLCAMLVDDVADVRPSREIDLAVGGGELDYLLFDFLSELLYRFETEHLLLADFDVRITDNGLTAHCRGEPADPSRHRLAHEVKAVTYHGLRVEQTADGWEAEIIVDI